MSIINDALKKAQANLERKEGKQVPIMSDKIHGQTNNSNLAQCKNYNS